MSATHTPPATTQTPAHTQGEGARPFSTQPWGATNRIDGSLYDVERVEFPSHGARMVGNLFLPKPPEGRTERRPGLAIIGPLAFVKEQAPVQYASRLVREDYVSLAFDPRYHGESEGVPRRFEDGPSKTADLRAALDYLASRPEVDPKRLFVVGICQGVNWAIQASVDDVRVKAVALIAGNYLTPAFAELYLGSKQEIARRLENARKAKEKYESTGEVDYAAVVGDKDPDALLLPKPIWEFYRRWADRGPFWDFHGQWENRVTRMSELQTWNGRAQEILEGLRTPTLMVHADRAANGPSEPKALFATIPAENKKLVWLGSQVQMQFYEDPITIDLVVPHVTSFFAGT